MRSQEEPEKLLARLGIGQEAGQPTSMDEADAILDQQVMTAMAQAFQTGVRFAEDPTT